MKYFTEATWSNFLYDISLLKTDPRDVDKLNKGQMFELLVEYLLEVTFVGKPLEFTATQTSHDGSKDFWGVDQESDLWWVECKNYEDNISVTHIAPTLFMAELYEVRHLLVFSHSKLNKNLKRKIAQYAYKHEKYVYIYEDITLEELVLSNLPAGLEHYAPKKLSLDESFVEVVTSHEKNPLFFNEKGFSGNYKVNELQVGDIYNIDTIIVNHNLEKECLVQLHVPMNGDAICFDFLTGSSRLRSEDKHDELIVKPNQIVMHRYSVRLNHFEKKLSMPIVYVDVKITDAVVAKHTSDSKKLICHQTNRDVFIGEHYERIVRAAREHCYNKNAMTGFAVYGPGGTGKTRILQECYSDLINNGYNVMNFTGFDVENNWRNVIREILVNIYSLDDDIVQSVLCDAASEGTKAFFRDPNRMTTLAMLTYLSRSNVSIEELRPFYNILFEKMAQLKVAIIIDNLQSYAFELVVFLKEMMQYYLTRNRRTSIEICLMVSINTSLVMTDDISSLLNTFLNGGNSINSSLLRAEEINGFHDISQAMLFLRHTLKLKDFPLNTKALESIVESAPLKPKHIQLIAESLKQEGAVLIKEGQGFIPNLAMLKKSLAKIPTGYSQLFKQNFRALIDANPHLVAEIERTLSLLHLFSKLSPEHVKMLHINHDTLFLLAKHNYIRWEGSLSYRSYFFEHDLDELCFANEIYPDLLEKGAKFLDDYAGTSDRLSSLVSSGVMILCELILGRAVICDVSTSMKALDSLPNKFHYGFLLHLLASVSRHSELLGKTEYIEQASHFCKYVRDHISEVKSSHMFDEVLLHISNFFAEDKNLLRAKHSFIVHMAETKMRIGDHIHALLLYNEHLQELSSYNPRETPCDWLDYAKAYIYNRIFVCGKGEGDLTKYMSFLGKSKDLCKAYGFHDIMFENYFDEANLYLREGLDIARAVDCLNHGFKSYNMLPEVRRNKFKGNYYSKKILLLCLSKKFKEGLQLTNEALLHIERNQKMNYNLFFKSKLLRYKIILLLILQNRDSEIVSTIEEFGLTITLLGKSNSFEVALYKAKYSLQKRDEDMFGRYFAIAFDAASKEKHQSVTGRCSYALEDLAMYYANHRLPRNITKMLNCTRLNTFLSRKILASNHTKGNPYEPACLHQAPISCDSGVTKFFII